MKGKGRVRRSDTVGGRNWRKNRCAAEVGNLRTSLVHSSVVAATLTEEVCCSQSSLHMLRGHGKIFLSNTGDNGLSDGVNIA